MFSYYLKMNTTIF